MNLIDKVRNKISNNELKVLVAGPTTTFNTTTDMINDAFGSLPCVIKSDIYDFRKDVQIYGFDSMARSMVSMSNIYDLIFVYKGDMNTIELNKKLSENCVLFLWYMDWIFNLKLTFNMKLNRYNDNIIRNNILNSSAYYHYRSATSYQTSVEWSHKIGKKVHHILDGSDPKYYYPLDLEKDIDVSFVGYVTKKPMDDERRSAVDILTKHKINTQFFPNKNHPNSLNREEVNSVYNRSKIVLNISRGMESGYSSVRLWNALMSGSFVISKYIKDLDRLGLKDGVHLVMYKNDKELLDKCMYFLSNKNERINIAKNGYSFAKTNRTWCNTTDQIIKTVEKYEPN